MNARSWNYLRVRGEYSSNRRAIFKSRELPPRARRILHSVDAVPLNIGTTSACAENTGNPAGKKTLSRNYLRVRGEYSVPIVIIIEHGGTTSACAENTPCLTIPSCRSRNYLRVRGEYSLRIPGSSPCTELPPRARRIQLWQRGPRINGGTTSACAENTSACYPRGGRFGNYLRVRGEYTPPAKWCGWSRELPPRARRILRARVSPHPRFGTTSACAENTARRVMCRGAGWNYLRVRGEYREPGLIERHRWELPPRARRILAVPAQRHRTVGTTSACAENTKVKAWLGAFFRNYLRVRGEYTIH